MRLEVIDNDNYKVYINSFYMDDFDINNNSELGKYIKEIILKIKKIYNIVLEGFYEVHVYILKYLGLIVEIKNIDRYVSKTIDLKIIVHSDEELYLQIHDYDLLDNYDDLKYLDNYFYINIDDLRKEDTFKFCEHYKVVYGDCLSIVKHKWHSLTK